MTLSSSQYIMSYTSNNLWRSSTRLTVLEYCQKKYYFNYYTNFLKDIDEKLRLDWLLLKNLKSIEMWIWEKTHHLLSDYLKLMKKKSDSQENINKLKEEITAIMTNDFNISKNKDYEAWYDKNQKFWLTEHYYKIEGIDQRLQDAIDKVINNLDTFISSERHDKVWRFFEISQSVYIESPKRPDYDNMRIIIDSIPELMDVSILASPDFGAILGDDRFTIIDRKSGKENMNDDLVPDQIKVYALKMILKKWKLNINDIDIKWYEVYLPSLQVNWWQITQQDIEWIIQKIINDVNFQKQFIVDWDVTKNIPVPQKNFQRTTSAKKCQTCTFRKICEDLKKFE